MEYYSQYSTGRTDALIQKYQPELDALIEQGRENEIENHIMCISAAIAADNLNKDGSGTISFDNIEGGPFATVIVKYEGRHPVIIGIGANHVAPECDPSAHGEVSAIRDACQRQGHADLSGATLFTSCECCPQCLSSAIGSGIKRIIYANDRFQAAAVGFSDESQYRLMQDVFKSMQKADAPIYGEKLSDNDAVIIDGQGAIISAAHLPLTGSDPMAQLPSMRAIADACRKLGHFHLPAEFTLISRKIPHPAAFITADWARIGRIRDLQHPDDPSRDKFEKDTSKIIYIDDEFEEMNIACGKIAQSAKAIISLYEDDVKTNKIGISIERSEDKNVLNEASKAFSIWRQLISLNEKIKY